MFLKLLLLAETLIFAILNCKEPHLSIFLIYSSLLLVRLYMLAILTSCPLPIWGVSYCGGCAMYLTDHCGRKHSWTRATVTMHWNPSLIELVLRLLLPQLLPIFVWVWLGYRFVLARHGTYLLTQFGSETPSWLSKTCLDLDCTVVWGSPIWFSVLLSEACQPSQPSVTPSLFPFTQVLTLIKSFPVWYCLSLRGKIFQISWKRSKLIGNWRCFKHSTRLIL